MKTIVAATAALLSLGSVAFAALPAPAPIDPLATPRQEMVSAWDAGAAAEQRKTNAVSGMITAVNNYVAGLQKQMADQAAAAQAADAKIKLLENQLAAAKKAAELKPNPVLKAHRGGVVTDTGRTLMLEPAPHGSQSYPARGSKP